MRHRPILAALVAVALGCSGPTSAGRSHPTAVLTPTATTSPTSKPAPLAWRPPALRNPVTVTLCNCNIEDGQIIVKLNAGQDYVLKDTAVLNYPVVIQGGHNVVWIGGEVRPAAGPDIGIQLSHNVGAGGGTVHLEGIYLDGIGGVLYDGIEGGEFASLSKPRGTLSDATLQVENVRIDGLSGDSSVEHQDCIQHYGGWKDLRVDHFTCRTLYQGFTLPWEDGSVSGVLSHWDLRNANLQDAPNGTGGGMQTLLHFGDSVHGEFNAQSHRQGGNLSHVYLHATQKSLDQETYPNSGTKSVDGTIVHATVNADGTIGWGRSWSISGAIIAGGPPGGDYVPLGVAGLRYVSPGYQ